MKQTALLCMLAALAQVGCAGTDSVYTSSSIASQVFPVAHLLPKDAMPEAPPYGLLLLTERASRQRNVDACLAVVRSFGLVDAGSPRRQDELPTYIPLAISRSEIAAGGMAADQLRKSASSGMAPDPAKEKEARCERIVDVYDYTLALRFLSHPEVNRRLSQAEREGPILVAVPPPSVAAKNGFLVLSMAGNADGDFMRAVDVWTVHVASPPEDWHKKWWLDQFRESLRNALKQAAPVHLALIAPAAAEALTKKADAAR